MKTYCGKNTLDRFGIILWIILILIVCSLFGRAFEQAAKNTNSYIDADYFDSTSKSCLWFSSIYF